jgi:DNA-binding transcriptional ArsR family regulator
MLKAIFGSEKKGKILLFIYANGESYPTEIARVFGYYVNSVQNHLANMEKSGILYSKLKGKVRLYGLNPRYPFKKELEALFDKILKFVPQEEKEKFYVRRLRPRLTGKPL